MPVPASITPPSGTGSGGTSAIQVRRQAISASDSGGRPCGIRIPQVGRSTATFSSRYDASRSPGTSSVFVPQPFDATPASRSTTPGDSRSRNSACRAAEWQGPIVQRGTKIVCRTDSVVPSQVAD